MSKSYNLAKVARLLDATNNGKLLKVNGSGDAIADNTVATAGEAQAFTAGKLIDAAGLASAFQSTNQSLSTNGYQRLPGGLILQWGEYAGGAHGPVISFPVTFPTASYSVTTAGATDNDSIAVTALSNSQFTASQLDQSNATSTNATTGFYWIAIGR